MNYITLILLAFNYLCFYETRTKPTVLVLPPYDEIANAGISPDIQQFLEDNLMQSEKIKLIRFSTKKFKDVSYQMIFDKRYCKAIIEKEKVDIIIMSKIVYKKRTGNMNTELWDFQLLLYNANLDRQIHSKIKANDLTSGDIQKLISNNIEQLVREIIK